MRIQTDKLTMNPDGMHLRLSNMSPNPDVIQIDGYTCDSLTNTPIVDDDGNYITKLYDNGDIKCWTHDVPTGYSHPKKVKPAMNVDGVPMKRCDAPKELSKLTEIDGFLCFNGRPLTGERGDYLTSMSGEFGPSCYNWSSPEFYPYAPIEEHSPEISFLRQYIMDGTPLSNTHKRAVAHVLWEAMNVKVNLTISGDVDPATLDIVKKHGPIIADSLKDLRIKAKDAASVTDKLNADLSNIPAFDYGEAAKEFFSQYPDPSKILGAGGMKSLMGGSFDNLAKTADIYTRGEIEQGIYNKAEINSLLKDVTTKLEERISRVSGEITGGAYHKDILDAKFRDIEDKIFASKDEPASNRSASQSRDSEYKGIAEILTTKGYQPIQAVISNERDIYRKNDAGDWMRDGTICYQCYGYDAPTGNDAEVEKSCWGKLCDLKAPIFNDDDTLSEGIKNLMIRVNNVVSVVNTKGYAFAKVGDYWDIIKRQKLGADGQRKSAAQRATDGAAMINEFLASNQDLALLGNGTGGPLRLTVKSESTNNDNHTAADVEKAT